MFAIVKKLSVLASVQSNKMFNLNLLFMNHLDLFDVSSKVFRINGKKLFTIYFTAGGVSYHYYQIEEEGEITANNLTRRDLKKIPDAIKYDLLDILQAMIDAEFN